MKKNILLLDCTLRDGGQLLEEKNRLKKYTKDFDDLSYKDIIYNLTKSNIDIIELGSVEIGDTDKKEYNIYRSIEEISTNILSNRSSEQMYAAFFSGPDIPIKKIPDKYDGLIDLIRMSIRYSELEKSLDYCAELSKKGYLVSIQPIVSIRYTEKDFEKIVKAANKMNAYSVYIVDSYGSMSVDDTKVVFERFDNELKPNIKIGIHSHNNMCMAVTNTIEFIKYTKNRDIIIDSCCLGMGKGTGNLHTEFIIDYVNKNYGEKYDFISILNACESISNFTNESLWGYTLEQMLCGVYGVAYKYGTVLRNKYHYSYLEIAKALSGLSQEARYRYTDENLKKILKK